MKAYWVSTGIALALDGVSSQSLVLAAPSPRESCWCPLNRRLSGLSPL